MIGVFRDWTRGWVSCPLCRGVSMPWEPCSECGGIGVVPPLKRSVLATPKPDRTCDKAGCTSPLLAAAPSVKNGIGEFHPGCWSAMQVAVPKRRYQPRPLTPRATQSGPKYCTGCHGCSECKPL